MAKKRNKKLNQENTEIYKEIQKAVHEEGNIY